MGRKYDREFKIEAVKLALSLRNKQSLIERELGIGQGIISKWKKELSKDEESAFPGKGHLKPADEELRALRQEVGRLRRERDILKKSGVHLLGGPGQVFGFISGHQTQWSIKEMCRVLKVSRSGY